MIKKIFLFLSIIIPFVAPAQLGVGNWKLHSSFSGVNDIVETPSKVYYVSDNALFSYDKEKGETYSYNIANKLNDNKVTRLFYNKDGKYLAVVYESANIDLIYENGKIVNMSDIKDVPMSITRTINDVSFHDGKIYVATNFGLVIFDDKKHEVIQSGNYNRNVEIAEIVNGYLMLVSEYDYYWIPLDSRINSLDNFEKKGRSVVKYTHPLGNDKFAALCGNYNLLRIYESDMKKGHLNVVKELNTDFMSDFHYMSDGSCYAVTAKDLYVISPSGEVTVNHLPAMFEGDCVGAWNGMKSVWAGNSQGIGNYKIDDGNVTVISDRYIPEAMTVKKVGRLYVSPSEKIYAASYGSSHNLNAFKDKYNELYHVNIINDGEIRDVTPVEFDVQCRNNASLTSLPYGFKDGYDIVEDPSDPDAYYVGSIWDGVYRIKDGKQTHKYYKDNSTLVEVLPDYALRALSMDFDRRGNLWVGCHVKSGDNYTVHMLTSDGLKKSKTTAADWEKFKFGDYRGERDFKVKACRKSDMIFIFSGEYDAELIAYDTKGTTSTSDDTWRIWSSFIDQDGKTYSYNYIYSICEDNNGRVWIGTNDGVIEITRPGDATNPDMRINHIKIPRNDGTNYADYLLDSQNVYAIAVDSSNRKWLATETAGVYYVNETGSEILNHYDIDNSILPTNTVYAIACDPHSNSVYFGTEFGLVEYSSTAAPASDDYSDVYAYPNPVRPDYTGWITVTGLMENSLVKITDAAGNVFFQGRSEGGMVTWDGCNNSGQRVKTGVYYVFASQNESGQSSGAVTKILVVN